MTTETHQPFAEWCIVELLGHRRLAGHIQEIQLAGAGFLRLDIPAEGADPARTQYIAPGSVYALHPVTEATARAAARQWRPEPVSRWELTALAGFPNPPFEAAGAVACTEDDMSYHGDEDEDERAAAAPGPERDVEPTVDAQDLALAIADPNRQRRGYSHGAA